MTVVTKALVVIASLALCSAALAAEEAKPEIAKVAKTYRGPEGLKLTVLRIGPEADKTFLVKYDGIDHAWSGKVMKARRINAGSGHDLVVPWKGEDWHTAVERDTWGWKRMQVYLPDGGPEGADVSYDEKLSNEASPERILAEYLKQQPKDAPKK